METIDPLMPSPDMAYIASAMAATAAIVFAIIAAMLLAFYVYNAFVMSTIARKLNHPRPWQAWIPFANVFLNPQLAGWNWTWGFVYLGPLLAIPFVLISVYQTVANGIMGSDAIEVMLSSGTFIVSIFALLLLGLFSLIMDTIWFWKIFVARGYHGALSLVKIGGGLPYVGWIFSIGWLVVLGIVAWHDLSPVSVISKQKVK